MRHKPRLEYSGLTIILSNPSRFDQHQLISGTAGHYFQEECLPCSRLSCDIRTSDTRSQGLLEGTNRLLLLGDRAFQEWTDGQYKDYSLSEQRGSPLRNPFNLPCIASYSPQDAMDPVGYEQKYNPASIYESQEDGEQEDEDEYDSKKKGRTKRSNYRFWLKWDTRKIFFLSSPASTKETYTYGSLKIKPETFILAPRLEEILQFLRSIQEGETLYLDIETTVEGGYNLLCIGICTETSPVYVIPIFRFDGRLHYSSVHLIFALLSNVFQRTIVVCHNGFSFDLFILCWRYGIPFGLQNYDTLIAQHRCFPEAEKSLGHCIPGYELVDTVSGRIPIRELVGKENFYVWSWKDNNPFPAKVNKVFKTREKTKIIRVKCWRRTNGENEYFNIDCTPDHKFLINNQWIEAKNLTRGTKLTRVKIHYGKSYGQYDRISYTKYYKNKRERVHRYIYSCLNPLNKIESWEDIHHKDNNKWNNNPDNLVKLDSYVHQKEFPNKNGGPKNQPSKYKNTYLDKRTNEYKDVPLEEIKKLYESGMSQREVGEKFGMSQGAISFILRKNKIKTRTAEEGQAIYYSKNNNCTVIEIEELSNTEDVFCLEVEDTNCFSCKGVIIHNCMSLWTWEEYHKDGGIFHPRNIEEEKQLWLYNGKDVAGMRLIKQEIDRYAQKIPGLPESIRQGCACIYPYLLCSLNGIAFNANHRANIIHENDRLMNHYLRMVNILVGEYEGTLLPTSSQSCVKFFHDYLRYDVVSRSRRISKKTGKPLNTPSLDEKAFWKLKLKYPDNVLIDVCLKYRQKKKESSMLKFQEWEFGRLPQ